MATPVALQLRPVEVVAHERESETSERDRALRIVTPAGFRIEGLALDDVIAIVRVLG